MVIYKMRTKKYHDKNLVKFYVGQQVDFFQVSSGVFVVKVELPHGAGELQGP